MDTLVHRDQLPLPRPYRAPRTATERQIAEVWCSVLGMDLVGLDDSFRDLGGDSLHATVIFRRLEAGFGRRLPSSMLERAGTVAELAALIGNPA